jgi:hypothetical protein
VTTANLNVTNSITLSGGSMSCPGGALAANCFGLVGACPAFDTCYLNAMGFAASSTSTLNPPRLDVGMTGLAGKGIVRMGLYPTSPIASFSVYANQSFAMASLNTPLYMTSYLADMFISSVGGTGIRTTVSSTGRISVEGPVSADLISTFGITTVAAGGASIQLSSVANTITASASNTTFTSTDFNVYRQPSVLWFRTQSTQSLTCSATTGPLSGAASTSIFVNSDVIQQAGTSLMSNAPNGGLVRVSGLEMCGQLITTTGTTLQLQNSTATRLLDVQAVITNSDPLYGVTIIDVTSGVNFQDTAIHNELGAAGPLVCDDQQGFSLLANNTLFVNKIAPVNGTNITVQGNLYVTGSVSAAGSCCTSDERVKRNVTAVDPASDLQTVLSLPPRVSFHYTDDYLAVERHADRGRYSGFIAQQLERVVPRAVYETTLEKTPGFPDGISDFRHVSMDALVPYLVGAIKQLNAELQELKQQLKK